MVTEHGVLGLLFSTLHPYDNRKVLRGLGSRLPISARLLFFVVEILMDEAKKSHQFPALFSRSIPAISNMLVRLERANNKLDPRQLAVCGRPLSLVPQE